MSEKTNLQELIDKVALSTGADKRRCDGFVRALFEAIASALEVDGVAKIKGLGTFKLLTVEERKSVNVQTGEEVVIPVHTKVSFLPDKALKEAVNKPFAHLQTYILNSNAPVDGTEDESGDGDEDGDSDEQEDESSVVEADSDNIDDSADENVTVVSSDNASEADKPQDEQLDENEPMTNDNHKDVEENAANKEDLTNDGKHLDWADDWELEYSGPEPNPENVKTSISLEESESITTPSAERNSEDDTPKQSLNENSQEEETTCVSDENTSLVDSHVEIDENKEESDENKVPDDIVPEVEVQKTNLQEKEETQKIEETPENPTVADPFVNLQAKDKKKDKNQPVVTPQQVRNRKIMGVCIVMFVLILVMVVIAVIRIDPDFFKNMRKQDAGETPPVMPTDTTSLTQELNVYKTQNGKSDSIVNNDAKAKTQKSVSTSSESNKNKADKAVLNSVASTAPSNQSPDKKFRSDFVSYMQTKHPQVRLSTSGKPEQVVLVKGLRLTLVALKAYGDKKYWIYLYLYNKDKITDPDRVKVGTVLTVPNLDKTLVNGNNAQTLSIASEVISNFAKH
jgi:nucleoid DNA-binding protein/Na+-transporting methylmalonyl-CoA/oxaloacetate decarboxylase gamma subunit